MRSRYAGMVIPLVILVGLGGCGTAGGNSPGGSPVASTPATAAASAGTTPGAPSPGAPSASVMETPAATNTPAPAFAELSLAVIAVSNLKVRSAPSTSAAEITGIRPLAGDLVLVVGGPVEAQGYRWYAAGFANDPSNAAAIVPVGWIAAGPPTSPWLEPDTGSCPQPTVTSLARLAGILRIGCYRSDAFTFDAHEAQEPEGGGLGGACVLPPSEPVWLACDVNYSFVNADGGSAWLVQLHFDPTSGIQPTPLAPAGTVGPALRITGHYNDPAAHACVTASDPKSLDGLSQWLTCAQRLVVEKLLIFS